MRTSLLRVGRIGGILLVSACGSSSHSEPSDASTSHDAHHASSDARLPVDGGHDAAHAVDAGHAPDAGHATDAGHIPDGPLVFPDAGPPPSLACSTSATLTATETSLLNMPADSWMDLPSTDFQTFCQAHQDPSLRASEGCDAVINDWSGGVFDDAEHQMILWGGGHDGYWGNEVYAFSPATAAWSLLTNATPVPAGQSPTEPMPDGTPDSRHTYSTLAYLESQHMMFARGGATSPNGYASDLTWIFDPVRKTWSRGASSPSDPDGHYFVATAYDPASTNVFTRDDQGIWEFSFAQDAWLHLVDYGFAPYYPVYTTYNYRSAVVVPSQHRFIAVGGTLAAPMASAPDFIVYDVSAMKDITSTVTMSGDTSVIASPGPGFSEDLAASALLAWAGGAPAIMDLGTYTWTRGSATNAPATQVSNGTYGRWRYIAYLNVFILVNNPSENVHFYKHTASCG